jgi:hypothetical protein
LTLNEKKDFLLFRKSSAMFGTNILSGLILMPLSQAVSWLLISQRSKNLLPNLFKISIFYFFWACHNRYLKGNPSELGQYSMGFLALTAFLRTPPMCMAATVVVMGHFCWPLYTAFSQPLEELALDAKLSKKVDALLWACVFRAYVLSNLALWGTVLSKLVTLSSKGVLDALPSRSSCGSQVQINVKTRSCTCFLFSLPLRKLGNSENAYAT